MWRAGSKDEMEGNTAPGLTVQTLALLHVCQAGWTAPFTVRSCSLNTKMKTKTSSVSATEY